MSVYRQGDPAWSEHSLGHGPATIGQAGCLLTVFAQVLCHYGHAVTPLALNNILMDQNRWVNGDLLADAAISGLFPDVAFITRWDFTNRPADLSVLTNNEEDEYIIEVDFDHNPNDGIQTHFVRFVSWDGTNLIIDDPEFGEEVNFTKHYGTDLGATILKIVKYTGPAGQATLPTTPIETVAAAPETAVNSVSQDAGEDQPDVTAIDGTATVVSEQGAHVRIAPSRTAYLNTAHAENGIVDKGVEFHVNGLKVAEDPYNDGRSTWYRTDHTNWVWGGNIDVVLAAAAGGEVAPTEPTGPAPTVESPVAPAIVETPEAPVEAPAETPVTIPETPAPEVPVETPAETPAVEVPVKARGGLQEIGYIAWLKPVLNDYTRQYEGAPVINLDTMEPLEVVPLDAKVPFTHFQTVDGVNYFKTEHMINNNLDYGIDGMNLQQAEQPAKVLDAVQAAESTPETSTPDEYVEDAIEGIGKVWRTIINFLDKHHPNNKESK